MLDKLKVFFGFDDHTPNSKTEYRNYIHIISATSYDNSIDISEKLKKGDPVILDISHLTSEQANRLIDFICGSTFAINGNIQKLTQNLYLFSPKNMPITQTKMSQINKNDSN